MFMYESSLRRQEIVLEPHLQSAIDQYHVSLGKVGFGFVAREVVQATLAASESHKGSGGAHTASRPTEISMCLMVALDTRSRVRYSTAPYAVQRRSNSSSTLNVWNGEHRFRYERSRKCAQEAATSQPAGNPIAISRNRESELTSGGSPSAFAT
jgi:hypothetical protein